MPLVKPEDLTLHAFNSRNSPLFSLEKNWFRKQWIVSSLFKMPNHPFKWDKLLMYQKISMASPKEPYNMNCQKK